VDSDCPSSLACINEKCQNPCPILRPCHPSAECRVVDSVPVRTMICMCPDGQLINRNSQCFPSKINDELVDTSGIIHEHNLLSHFTRNSSNTLRCETRYTTRSSYPFLFRLYFYISHTNQIIARYCGQTNIQPVCIC
jgi:hypothetical protein